VMALGRIAQLKAAGTELPPGVAATADGEPTTDPALAAVPLPAAGAKGSGMSLVFELLASGLVANPIVPGYHAGSAEGRRHRQNGFLLAVDVSAFLPLAEFTATVDATVDAIKALPPSSEAAEVLVPGERGRRCEAERRRAGVPLGPKPWRELTGLAEELGVPVPAPLGE
jgi:LDH2 family malate/lactate/ureidoglycolate dehydrogenase